MGSLNLDMNRDHMAAAILITGAAGKTGQAVIGKLAARGQTIRALVRRVEQAQVLTRLGVQETIVGDMADTVQDGRVLEKVQSIYLICPNMHPQEIDLGAITIRAAQAAGVKRIVYHSVLHPQVQAMPHHWAKMRVEEMLFASGLDYTILQPAAYMQNILAYWQAIIRDGLYAVPYALDTPLNLVDLQDIAEVAAQVLTEPGHQGALYELCGPANLSAQQIASTATAILARDVQAKIVPRDQWAEERRAAGLSPYALDTLLRMFRYYEQFGFRGNSRVLTCLLGRSPVTFAKFLERTAAAKAEY